MIEFIRAAPIAPSFLTGERHPCIEHESGVSCVNPLIGTRGEEVVLVLDFSRDVRHPGLDDVVCHLELDVDDDGVTTMVVRGPLALRLRHEHRVRLLVGRASVEPQPCVVGVGATRHFPCGVEYHLVIPEIPANDALAPVSSDGDHEVAVLLSNRVEEYQEAAHVVHAVDEKLFEIACRDMLGVAAPANGLPASNENAAPPRLKARLRLLPVQPQVRWHARGRRELRGK